jgi:hypothetical protein
MDTGTLFLDKSTFQSLSPEVAPFLQFSFVHGLTPTLVYEILADLTKAPSRGTPSQFVQALAAKFGGGGGAVNVSYQELILGELLGYGRVPMTGQIIPQGASFHDVSGESAMFVDLTAFNDAVIRWSHGVFRAEDADLALAWRHVTRNFSLLEFSSIAAREHLSVHRPKPDLSDLLSIVDGIIGPPPRQLSWISFLLSQIGVPTAAATAAIRRWRVSNPQLLSAHAPYTHFCLRSFIAVSTLWVHKLTKLEPNNYIDVQYLYYLPFFQNFASEDKLHRQVAPLLMRADQRLLRLEDLRQRVAARKPRGSQEG